MHIIPNDEIPYNVGKGFKVFLSALTYNNSINKRSKGALIGTTGIVAAIWSIGESMEVG